MKNIVTHIKAERAKRPKEQHLKLDTRHVDDLLEGIEAQQQEIINLENKARDREKVIAALEEKLNLLKNK